MKRLSAVLALLCSVPVVASACAPAGLQPTAAAVPEAVWRDAARFSFLVGRDYDSPETKMELMTRLRTFRGFASLRASASDWGPQYLKMLSLTQSIAQEASLADRLATLCAELDRSALGGKSIDKKAWTMALRNVAGTLEQLIASGVSFSAVLARYADVLDGAVDDYARTAHPVMPEADIGPDPSKVAAEVRDLQLRWRKIFVDLAFARKSLPTGPDGASETAMSGLDIAAAAVRGVAAESKAVAAAALPFETFRTLAGGDDLYDACAAAADRYVQLHNLFRSGSVLTVHAGSIVVEPPPTDPKPSRWLFRQDGNGYWTIENGTSGSTLLDYPSAPSGGKSLRLTGALGQGRPAKMSQLWRCYPSGVTGTVRFANATLGEGNSLDTPNNDPMATLFPTGRFSGQLWRIEP